MTTKQRDEATAPRDVPPLDHSPAERAAWRPTAEELHEMALLGLEPSPDAPLGVRWRAGASPNGSAKPQIARTEICSPDVLNDADSYFPTPSSFSRGIRIDLAGARLLFLSGTASIDDEGLTVYPGDLRAQTWRTYRNLTQLLASEGATWKDIVRTTCYLRDIERDYKDFNEVRTAFYHAMGLRPLPASTGIQARLCREDLLIEIEAIAIVKAPGTDR